MRRLRAPHFSRPRALAKLHSLAARYCARNKHRTNLYLLDTTWAAGLDGFYPSFFDGAVCQGNLCHAGL
jgi:hypothetical protein